jgi:methyltransferase
LSPSILIIAFVTAERALELWLARRNTARLIALGATEVAAGHYPAIVALHAAWLLGLWVVAWNRPVQLMWLGGYIVLEGLRAWVLATLRGRWTTRIIVQPGAALVRDGPYRFMAHPNYAVVAGEIAILPLAFGLFWYAVVFSALNAVVLAIRIQRENAALRRGSDGRCSPG